MPDTKGVPLEDIQKQLGIDPSEVPSLSNSSDVHEGNADSAEQRSHRGRSPVAGEAAGGKAWPCAPAHG
jgi:hypothetical protein